MQKRMAMTIGVILLAAQMFGCSRSSGDPDSVLSVQELVSPAGPGSAGPNLVAAEDGRVYLSWIEPLDTNRHALRFAFRTEAGWSTPRTIAQGNNWFVNWADFPSLTVLGDGTLAAHWLAKSGPSTYAYDVHIAFSKDGGDTWGKSIIPHRDGTQTEHGFVSLLPWGNTQLLAVWLDGRYFELDRAGAGNGPTSEMTLRYGILTAEGQIVDEGELDDRVCECCQTSATLTSNGVLVAYRDRSPEEIRDISVVRYRPGGWTPPRTVHADGWEIPGCPVNGPAVAAQGPNVAIAWYTAAGDSPVVRIAFSKDSGETFGEPVRVDDGNPVGRVDVLLLEEGSALVSWIEHTAQGGEIRVRRVGPSGSAGPSLTVATSSAGRASGFPRMVRERQRIVFAWTQPGHPSQVRTAVADLSQ